MKCIDLLTGKEDDSDLSHITIVPGDKDDISSNNDVARDLECITMGHQDMPSNYHDLTFVCPKEHEKNPEDPIASSEKCST